MKESISTTWFYSVGNWLWNSVYSNYRKLHALDKWWYYSLLNRRYAYLSMYFFLYIIDTIYSLFLKVTSVVISFFLVKILALRSLLHYYVLFAAWSKIYLTSLTEEYFVDYKCISGSLFCQTLVIKYIRII